MNSLVQLKNNFPNPPINLSSAGVSSFHSLPLLLLLAAPIHPTSQWHGIIRRITVRMWPVNQDNGIAQEDLRHVESVRDWKIF